MDEEDLRPRSASAVVGGGSVTRDLKTLSIDELEAYVADLRREAVRVEAEVARRRDVRGAADALFRKPPAGGGERRG